MTKETEQISKAFKKLLQRKINLNNDINVQWENVNKTC